MAKNTESVKQKPNAKASPESLKGSNGLEQTLWLSADKLIFTGGQYYMQKTEQALNAAEGVNQ